MSRLSSEQKEALLVAAKRGTENYIAARLGVKTPDAELANRLKVGFFHSNNGLDRAKILKKLLENNANNLNLLEIILSVMKTSHWLANCIANEIVEGDCVKFYAAGRFTKELCDTVNSLSSHVIPLDALNNSIMQDRLFGNYEGTDGTSSDNKPVYKREYNKVMFIVDVLTEELKCESFVEMSVTTPLLPRY